MPPQGWLARTFRHAINTWFPSDAATTDAAEWSRDRLVSLLRERLAGVRLVVVANREPYMHVRANDQLRWIRPASGLVTALDPIMRATGGVWVAHGSGSGDRETADESGRLAVPPGKPSYTLRRIWLTEEEEEGYYYGFANRALWPLCHIAYAAGLQRLDWERTRQRPLREAVLEDRRRAGESCSSRITTSPSCRASSRHDGPDAILSHFWHIPWPHREAFRICPWQEEILDGMLGSDLLGFHVQLHCNNFLETVDRLLESRVDYEHFSATRAGHETKVRPFPISIDMEGISNNGLARSDLATFRASWDSFRTGPSRRGGPHGLHQRHPGAPAGGGRFLELSGAAESVCLSQLGRPRTRFPATRAQRRSTGSPRDQRATARATGRPSASSARTTAWKIFSPPIGRTSVSSRRSTTDELVAGVCRRARRRQAFSFFVHRRGAKAQRAVNPRD